MGKKQAVDQIIATLRSGDRHDLVILAIPSHDRHNKPLNSQLLWADEALRMFSELFGGATSFQTFKGIYRSETGDDLWDNPILIESYTERRRVDDPDRIRILRGFIERMKRAMRQECVMLVVNEYRWFL